eukprot:6835324-Pyramimonas_sp.AAC.1
MPLRPVQRASNEPVDPHADTPTRSAMCEAGGEGQAAPSLHRRAHHRRPFRCLPRPAPVPGAASTASTSQARS